MNNLVRQALLNHKYYIIDNTDVILEVTETSFCSLEKTIQNLIYQECCGHIPEQVCNDRREINEILRQNGFEWDNLSECGHMRQRPEAVTIMEAIEKHVWKMASEFCFQRNIPLHRIRGGELLSLNNPQISKLYNLISRIPSYGNNRYTWAKSDNMGLLRYSACLQKLAFANEIDKNSSNLPIGIFEVSKSYRDEISETLQLCERVRSFYLPELHILNDSFDSALEITIATHAKIVENINTLYSDYIILCKMTYSFFIKHLDFLNCLADASGKPLVLWVLNEGEICNNGVEIDIEYKVTDLSGVQIEVATLQVDKGGTDFALGVQYLNNQDEPDKVSTIHCVFFASIERAAYCLIDSALKSLKTEGFYRLPFWAAPVQVRIVPENESCLKTAKSFAFELEQIGCRIDIDDRKISYQEKLFCEFLNWVPYLIKIQSEGNVFVLTENYNHDLTCEKTVTRAEIIENMSKVIDRRVIVPRYAPMEMSKKFQ